MNFKKDLEMKNIAKIKRIIIGENIQQKTVKF